MNFRTTNHMAKRLGWGRFDMRKTLAGHPILPGERVVQAAHFANCPTCKAVYRKSLTSATPTP